MDSTPMARSSVISVTAVDPTQPARYVELNGSDWAEPRTHRVVGYAVVADAVTQGSTPTYLEPVVDTPWGWSTASDAVLAYDDGGGAYPAGTVRLPTREDDQTPRRGSWAFADDPVRDLHTAANEAGRFGMQVRRVITALGVELTPDQRALMDSLTQPPQ